MLSTPGVLKLLSKNISNGLREMKNSYLKNSYLKEVTKYCPQITSNDLLPHPAGVRAQAISYQGKLIDDFVFDFLPLFLPPLPSLLPCTERFIDFFLVDRFRWLWRRIFLVPLFCLTDAFKCFKHGKFARKCFLSP